MKEYLRKLSRSFFSLIYPPLCLHCDALLEEKQTIFCSDCLAQLEMIDPEERCPLCFTLHESESRQPCQQCRRKNSYFESVASVFDYTGPASTLVQQMKYYQQPYLAKGAAAFLSAQFLQLKWPKPDLIVPVPIPLFKRWMRGYNQCLLLAEELSAILESPVQEVLIRKSGDYSQAGLSRKQRLAGKGTTIQLKSTGLLQDKVILVIDDVMTTGSTLRWCAEALQQDHPAHLYALTVCRAM